VVRPREPHHLEGEGFHAAKSQMSWADRSARLGVPPF
jgi:hypothetical protein